MQAKHQLSRQSTSVSQSLWGSQDPLWYDSRAANFACGLMAGLCAKLTTHPLDVVKKRYQVAGLQRSLRCVLDPCFPSSFQRSLPSMHEVWWKHFYYCCRRLSTCVRTALGSPLLIAGLGVMVNTDCPCHTYPLPLDCPNSPDCLAAMGLE